MKENLIWNEAEIKEQGKEVKDKLSMQSKGNILTLDAQLDQTHEQSARVLNLLLTTVLTYNQSSNICNCQVKKVDIGSSPHVLIADDDNAGGEITMIL